MNDQFQILRYDSLDSTNEQAKRLLREGAIERYAIVLAREQTRGKGSKGRSWASPRGAGVYLSVVDADPRSVGPNWELLSLSSALACAEVLLEQFDLRVQLKQINDLFVAGSKLGGVLVETIHESNRLSAVIAGVGINVADVPRRISASANEPVSLQEVLEADQIDKVDVLILSRQIARRIIYWNQVVYMGEKERLFTAWSAYGPLDASLSRQGALSLQPKLPVSEHAGDDR